MTESTVSIVTPDASEALIAMPPMERSIAALEITDEESHRRGLELGKRLKGMKELVLEMFREPKKKAHELHKSLTTNERKYLEPIEKTASLLNGKLTAYERREQLRADEEARARQKEADRVEAERTIAEAVAAEEAGDHDLAEAVLEAPRTPTVVIAAPRVAEVSGASTRTTYKAEVVNLLALLTYVAAHPEHVGLVQANEVALNGMARALKESMTIPGVRSVPNVSRSFRAE